MTFQKNLAPLKKEPLMYSGFTLLEVLIALFIFAIVAVITTTVLYTVFQARQRTNLRLSEMGQLQVATILLRRDITQLINRPIRLANGAVQPTLIATPKRFIFTRTGFTNPFGELQRSHLQRMGFEIVNHRLIRLTWPRLDPAVNLAPTKRVLLTQVISGRFQYLGKGKALYDTWPPGTLQTKQGEPEPLPRAIAITLELTHWGRLYLFIPIPASQL